MPSIYRNDRRARTRKRRPAIAWDCPKAIARAGKGQVFAALDLGTNNCRQLIARFDRGALCIVDSWSRITRLGEGLVETGALGDAAMERSIEALQICADRQKQFGVTASGIIATEACRRASNGDSFAERVRLETGLDLQIISSDREACYAVAGCESLMRDDVPDMLVFDIGGGSTELVHVNRNAAGDLAVRDVVSLPLGVVTMYETWGQSGSETAMMQAIQQDVATLLQQWPGHKELAVLAANDAIQLVGTSGTITTMAALSLGLERYQRQKVDGAVVSAEHIRAVAGSLARMTMDQRSNHDCIGAGRADLVLPGAAIVDAILDILPVREMTVADRGIREGILIELAKNLQQAGTIKPEPA